MRIIEKTIYYCDHCNKYYLSKYFAEKHEKFCSRNPENERACFGCQYLDKSKAQSYYDAYDGERERNVKILFCEKFNCGVYPPKVEINQNSLELVDLENYPMPKNCDTFINPFDD